MMGNVEGRGWRGRLWWNAALLGVICAGVFGIGITPLRPKPFSDGYFHEEAKGLRDMVYSGDWKRAKPLVHSPGIPFYYLPAYLLLREGDSERAHWYAAVGWNCLVLWGAALLLGRAAELLGGETAGKIARAAVPLSFFPLYYSAGVATETAAYAGAALVVWAGVRLLARRDGGWAWGAVMLGLGLGVLLAMRGNYVLTVPIVVLAGIVTGQKRMAAAACIAGVLGVLLSVGVFRAAGVLNRRMGTEARQDGFLTHVLIQGAFQYRSEPLDWRAWERETRGGSRDYEHYAAVRRQLDRDQKQTGLPMPELEWRWLRTSMEQEPWVWLRMAPMKALSALWFRISPMRVEKVLGRGLTGKIVAFLISLVLNAPFLALVVLAAWGTLRASRGMRSVQLMGWAPFVGGLLFVSLTYSEPRYIVPGMAGVAMLASVEVARRVPRGFGLCCAVPRRDETRA
jgi:4-amino-4-deoxy-L-arabinose transferase-like glycosyltransferase